jgi:hypothetical protein
MSVGVRHEPQPRRSRVNQRWKASGATMWLPEVLLVVVGVRWREIVFQQQHSLCNSINYSERMMWYARDRMWSWFGPSINTWNITRFIRCTRSYRVSRVTWSNEVVRVVSVLLLLTRQSAWIVMVRGSEKRFNVDITGFIFVYNKAALKKNMLQQQNWLRWDQLYDQKKRSEGL